MSVSKTSAEQYKKTNYSSFSVEKNTNEQKVSEVVSKQNLKLQKSSDNKKLEGVFDLNFASNEIVAVGTSELLKGAFDCVKDIALLGFDVSVGSALLLKELTDKDFVAPKFMVDSKDRLVGVCKGLKHLGSEMTSISIEANHLAALEIYEGQSGKDMTPEKKKVKERLEARVVDLSKPLKMEWEEYKELSPLDKYKKSMRITGRFLAEAYLLVGHKLIKNKTRYGSVKKPPKFKNTEYRDLRTKHFKGLTPKQIREAHLPNSQNPYGFKGNQDCLFVIYEVNSKPVLKIAPVSICNHPELARLPNGKMPEFYTAGIMKWKKGPKFLDLCKVNVNGTGHIKSHGTHLESLVEYTLRKNGFPEVSSKMLTYTETPWPFNPKRGYIEGLPTTKIASLPDGEWQYVWLEHVDSGMRELKIAPQVELWNHAQREITLAELSLCKDGKMARVIEYCKFFKLEGVSKRTEHFRLWIKNFKKTDDILHGEVLYNPPISPKLESSWLDAICMVSEGAAASRNLMPSNTDPNLSTVEEIKINQNQEEEVAIDSPSLDAVKVALDLVSTSNTTTSENDTMDALEAKVALDLVSTSNTTTSENDTMDALETVKTALKKEKSRLKRKAKHQRKIADVARIMQAAGDAASHFIEQSTRKFEQKAEQKQRILEHQRENELQKVAQSTFQVDVTTIMFRAQNREILSKVVSRVCKRILERSVRLPVLPPLHP